MKPSKLSRGHWGGYCGCSCPSVDVESSAMWHTEGWGGVRPINCPDPSKYRASHQPFYFRIPTNELIPKIHQALGKAHSMT